MNITVHIHKEPDGRYSAVFPALPCCFTDGDTREELMHNIHEAIDCRLGRDNVNPSEKLDDGVEQIFVTYKPITSKN